MGFYLGKFIYILDAYDDLEKDRAQGSYNPLLKMADEEGYEERCRQMQDGEDAYVSLARRSLEHYVQQLF